MKDRTQFYIAVGARGELTWDERGNTHAYVVCVKVTDAGKLLRTRGIDGWVEVRSSYSKTTPVHLVPIEFAPSWLLRKAVACPYREYAPEITAPEDVDDTPLRGVVDTLLKSGHSLRGWNKAVTHIDGRFIDARICFVGGRVSQNRIASGDGGTRFGGTLVEPGHWVLEVHAFAGAAHTPQVSVSAEYLLVALEKYNLESDEFETQEPPDELKRLIQKIKEEQKC